MKSATYDGGIRVPLIARWPGRIPGGRVNKEVCASIDLFPTLCKLAGARLPEDRPSMVWTYFRSSPPIPQRRRMRRLSPWVGLI
jgi:Arylsulfatase A and related enzymes